MANSKFQQAREAMLEIMDAVTQDWSEEERREMKKTVNTAFFSGEVKLPASVQARLEGKSVRGADRRRGRQ